MKTAVTCFAIHHRVNVVVCGMFGFLGILALMMTMPTMSHADSGIPEGMEILDDFQPGFGEPVGAVEMVHGNVVVIHQNATKGYRATKGLPLFKGDTIGTGQQSRIRLRLNDGSILTLGQDTSLVINRSVFNPDTGNRSSYIGMGLGKARFWVKKLFRFKRSEFRVKTRTAVLGVRGSDFIVYSTETNTKVVALDDTEIEVISLVDPSAPPVIVRQFQKIDIEFNALPSEVQRVTDEDIEQIKEELMIQPDMETVDIQIPVQEILKDYLAEHTIEIPESEIIPPEIVKKPSEFDSNKFMDRIPAKTARTLDDQGNTIVEEVSESDIQDQALEAPDFPGVPVRENLDNVAR